MQVILQSSQAQDKPLATAKQLESVYKQQLLILIRTAEWFAEQNGQLLLQLRLTFTLSLKIRNEIKGYWWNLMWSCLAV